MGIFRRDDLFPKTTDNNTRKETQAGVLPEHSRPTTTSRKHTATQLQKKKKRKKRGVCRMHQAHHPPAMHDGTHTKGQHGPATTTTSSTTTSSQPISSSCSFPAASEARGQAGTGQGGIVDLGSCMHAPRTCCVVLRVRLVGWLVGFSRFLTHRPRPASPARTRLLVLGSLEKGIHPGKRPVD